MMIALLLGLVGGLRVTRRSPIAWRVAARSPRAAPLAALSTSAERGDRSTTIDERGAATADWSHQSYAVDRVLAHFYDGARGGGTALVDRRRAIAALGRGAQRC